MAQTVQQETISIGPDKEIKLLEVDYDSSSVLKVNEFIDSNLTDLILKYNNTNDPLGQFWNKLETECLVVCCGINAFGLWPEDIARSVEDLDRKDLLEQLENLRNQILNTGKQIINYHRLNYSFAKVSFLELIDYLITQVKQWL